MKLVGTLNKVLQIFSLKIGADFRIYSQIYMFTFLHMTASGTRARFLKVNACTRSWHFISIFDLIQISSIKSGSDVHLEGNQNKSYFRNQH